MKISGKTPVYAVLGDPVAHSLSPAMHNAWLDAAGIDAVYVALRAAGPDPLAALATLELAGVNITIPHKEAAAALAVEADARAHRLGAANVLTRRAYGGYAAANTDAPGFIAALDEAEPGWRARVQTALVVGAGGAGTAILDGLKEAGVAHLMLANRTFERAAAGAFRVGGVEALSWDSLSQAFAAADLIVNATSVGLKGQGGADWPFHAARKGAIAADAVYRPLRTGFLNAAVANGLATVDGLGMLIHQGALAFEIWFGQRPDTKAARALLLGLLAQEDRA
jgi:shikimate dehydrogenase